MEALEYSAYTEDDKYFGICGADGKFKVWDTSSGLLHQEFTPDSHLTSPCSCLAWVVTARNQTKRKKISAKGTARESSDSGGTLNIAALGTGSGAIHLYSLATGKVESVLEGHLKRVNHLSWNKKTNLFSCAEDNLIIEWNVSTQEIVSKMKVGKESASCILVLPDGKSLISARNTISWWDLGTKKVIKTYSGHASPVMSLIHATGGSSMSDNYVLSAARDDIYISAWPLHLQKKSISDVAASFVAVEPPKSVTILSNEDKEATTLAVVTVGGYLQVFRHKLNGKSGKPLKPSLSVEISRLESKHDPLPFVNAKLLSDDRALVAYGNTPLFSFEKISIICEKKTLCLIRNASENAFSSQSKSASVSKVKVPVEATAKYVKGPKRAINGEEKSDMPMADRLEVLALNSPVHDIFTAPTSSMTHQLVQGLYSKNETLLQGVLSRREPDVIYNTVSMLPLKAIAPLIRLLANRVQDNHRQSKAAIAWLRNVLSVHAGQLLAAGDLTDVFSEVMGVVETKLQVLSPLMQLRGRLDLLIEQVDAAQSNKLPCPLPDDQFGTTPMLNYVDNVSSDESSDLEEVLGSDSEDGQWDEQPNSEGNNGVDGVSDSGDQDVEMGD